MSTFQPPLGTATMPPTLRPGILRAFDSTNYLATVQLSGSQAQHVANIPVARDIAAAEMTAGRKVAVAFFDPSNISDACLIAVWT
jgi:hypothetical protein